MSLILFMVFNTYNNILSNLLKKKEETVWSWQTINNEKRENPRRARAHNYISIMTIIIVIIRNYCISFKRKRAFHANQTNVNTRTFNGITYFFAVRRNQSNQKTQILASKKICNTNFTIEKYPSEQKNHYLHKALCVGSRTLRGDTHCTYWTRGGV